MSTFKDNVKQVKASHLVDFNGKKVILLGLAGILRVIEFFDSLSDKIGGTNRHSLLDVLWLEELLNSGSLAF